MRPIWLKLRSYDALRIGYSAGTSDCIMSLSMWQKLSDRMIEKVAAVAACAAVRDGRTADGCVASEARVRGLIVLG